jgi:hypothetical protein
MAGAVTGPLAASVTVTEVDPMGSRASNQNMRKPTKGR